MNAKDTQDLRISALEHLWIPHQNWVKMAEEGEPTILVEGYGIKVTDSEGGTWIDVSGGYASVNVGYGRTEIADAVRQQMLKLTYFPAGTTTEPLVRFVEKLAQITPGSLERTFPVTGGSEANEVAIKIARAYYKRIGEPGRYKIVSRRGSYHGATGGVVWLGGNDDRSDFEPAYPGMVHGPHPDPYRCELGGANPSECAVRCAQAIEDLILFHGPGTIAAVIAEAVSYRTPGVAPGDEYWPMIREICDKYGILLIDDEVICGFGRTGKMFGIEHSGVVPDIMTVAKGVISCYLPMAATIVTREVAGVFAGEEEFLRESVTAGGNPVSAAAALKNIEIIEQDALVQNAAATGAYFLELMRGLEEEHPIIGAVRGVGLLMGMELVKDRETKEPFLPEVRLGERLTEKLRQQGLILRTNGKTIQMGPPLCTTTAEADEIVMGMGRAIGEMEQELSVTA